MNVPSVKKLAQENTLAAIDQAVASFEKSRANELKVEGANDGEIMSNLLAAQFVRQRMEKGADLNSALREYGQRVKGILGSGFGPAR